MLSHSKPYTRLFSEVLPSVVNFPSHKDRQIQNLQMDSRKVQSGDVFLAVNGQAVDGRRFIQDAIGRGAVAIIAEKGLDAEELLAFRANVPVVEVDQLTLQVGEIAAKFFGHPTQRMQVAGITGTNGKTSVSFMLSQALSALEKKCGLVGTLGWGLSDTKLNHTINTTPDPVSLQRIFFEFEQQQINCVAMEVSAHGLDQGRVNGTQFTIAVLTNLSRDHLDDFKTMEAYAAAKAKLFSWPGTKKIVLNADDSLGKKLEAQVEDDLAILSFGLDSKNNPDLLAENIQCHVEGIRFTLKYDTESLFVSLPLYGRFNVSNCLAVVAVLLQMQFSLKKIVKVLPLIKPPKGRMEIVKVDQGPTVIVDYAHTPDALDNLLRAVREHGNQQVICVFGCGGNRDSGKRALMGEIAERAANRVVITNDNPRFEDSTNIVKEIVSGMHNPDSCEIQLDRKKAIHSSIFQAKAGDLVVIAGKGHESYQDIQGERIPFNDYEQVCLVARQLNQKNSASSSNASKDSKGKH